MKALQLLFLFLGITVFCNGQDSKEQKFNIAIKDVINSLSLLNADGVSKFIDKHTGVYVIYRSGAFDNFRQLKEINFQDSTYPSILFSNIKGINYTPLRYAVLPVYNCDEEKWSKQGLFTDTLHVDHSLSNVCKRRNEFVPDSIPANKINFFYELENKSRCIILNDANGKSIVFYMSFLNANWFLTIVDFASSDCSA